jgi:hypothetical protein
MTDGVIRSIPIGKAYSAPFYLPLHIDHRGGAFRELATQGRFLESQQYITNDSHDPHHMFNVIPDIICTYARQRYVKL